VTCDSYLSSYSYIRTEEFGLDFPIPGEIDGSLYMCHMCNSSPSLIITICHTTISVIYSSMYVLFGVVYLSAFISVRHIRALVIENNVHLCMQIIFTIICIHLFSLLIVCNYTCKQYLNNTAAVLQLQINTSQQSSGTLEVLYLMHCIHRF